jgi:hypothetical protein
MTTLGDYLKGKGFQVDDSSVPYGREAAWDKVRWLFVHHTAGSEASGSEAGQANYIKTASGRYPPLAQLMLGQSGKVWVCSKQRSGQKEPGRASHAGEGSYPGIPKDTANEVSLGVEVHCDGSHPLRTHGSQYEVLIRLLSDLCSRYGLTSANVVGHKEYSSTGKIDPRDNMDTIRRDVSDRMKGDADTGDDMLAVLRLKTSTDQPIPSAPSANNVDWDSENDPQGWHADPGLYPSVSCRKTGWASTYVRLNPKGEARPGDRLVASVTRNEEPGDDSSWVDVDTCSWEIDNSGRYTWSPIFKCYEGHKYRLSVQVEGQAATLDYAIWAWLVSKQP